jgi:uncharacterized protein (TIGR03437 family)
MKRTPSKPTCQCLGWGVWTIRDSFRGLQGFAGLYQVNFIVPTTMPDLRLCVCTGFLNLTVTVHTINSFGGAGICVLP